MDNKPPCLEKFVQSFALAFGPRAIMVAAAQRDNGAAAVYDTWSQIVDALKTQATAIVDA